MGSDKNSEASRRSSVVSPETAAAYMNVAVSTLAKWRVSGLGPMFIKVGRAVRYDARDLDAWLDSRRHTNTSERN